ncbi:EF hand family protein [Nesidiocoris tenuis]|uniref:EF hand family protein n=1 Tax=Nesidiocoris tenuis TaxID=355587 RepID=A0ABN7AQ27_9HEMI|nr:EF hand family protein [Nesidiocoris tenuis]
MHKYNQVRVCQPCTPSSIKVTDTLQKIRQAAYRMGFNFWDIFSGMEPPGKRYIAVHKFLTVLGGPLKEIIGLGEIELRNLAANFKVTDGRIDFDRFCRMVHPEIPARDKDGYSCENMQKSNKLGVTEENRLLIMLTKIAVACPNLNFLNAQFEDCEKQRKNDGLVSRGSFFRVLTSNQLEMSPFEQELLFEKYKRDSLSMKYLVFVNDLKSIQTLLRQQPAAGTNDVEGFPIVESCLLPRPEGPYTVGQGVKKIFLPGWKGQTAPEEYIQILDKIKEHVIAEKLRIDDLFKQLDGKKLGRIRADTFKNGLEFLRLSRTKFTDMYLSEKEMDMLCDVYADPVDPERVVWQEFVNDVFEDLPSDDLSQWPPLDPNTPSRKPTRLLKPVPPKIVPDLYQDEDGFFKVLGRKLGTRKVNLRKGFAEYDPLVFLFKGSLSVIRTQVDLIR